MADQKQVVPISELHPSAARLLLALATRNDGEEMDAVMMRAGIRSVETFLRAKQQLLDGKYIFFKSGKQQATLKPEK